MTVTAYEQIRTHSVDLVEEQKIDTREDLEATRGLVRQAVSLYQHRAQLGQARALRDPDEMVERVVRAITGYGPLTDLLARPDVEEVFIEGTHVSYIDGSGRLRALSSPTSGAEVGHVIDRLLAETDRSLDTANPIVQARVLNGTARLTAVIPPVSDRLSASIRRYALRNETLASMVDLGALTPPAAEFLRTAMQTNLSMLISGPPGAGKTSLLSALIAAAPASHCIRCCEEVRELHVPLVHGSYYEARPPGSDGSGEITMRELVKLILAMRPDRIVVGEVRGSEAFELTRAANAGCGFACTVHANSATEALEAVVNAALMAGENVHERFVRKVLAASIDLVVHLDREGVAEFFSEERLRREVMEILAVVPSLHDDFSTEPIFVRDRLGTALTWTGSLLPQAKTDLLERATGLDLRSVLDGRVALA